MLQPALPILRDSYYIRDSLCGHLSVTGRVIHEGT
jgi:hypothetical protein